MSMNDIDTREAVILVVGNEQEDKTAVVESIAQGDAWTCRTTAAGARILTRKSPHRIVVDTTLLRSVPDKSPTAIARRWISRNGLRRILFGKQVFVVCVVPTAIAKFRCNWDIFFYSHCWVDVFGLVFAGHKKEVMIVVNTKGIDVPDVAKVEMKRFVKEHEFKARNVTYSNVSGGDDAVRSAVEKSVGLGHFKQHTLSSFCRRAFSKKELPQTCQCFFKPRIQHTREVQPMMGERKEHRTAKKGSLAAPFFMQAVTSNNNRFGPWGPERVILFGRAGSGKSTLAQMLTLGRLDPSSETFPSGSSIRGVSRSVQPGEGRGWYVLDTPGFGELTGRDCTISTEDAERKVKRYVKHLEGTFSHYLYVVKKDRIDMLEERLWKFFVLLFGEDISRQFSVVVSGEGADKEWIEANLTDLRNSFHTCNSFLSAEFPSVISDDDECEAELEDVRTTSLAELEDELGNLGRTDMHCKYGEHSEMHKRNERDRGNIDVRIEQDIRIRILVGGANAFYTVGNVLSKLISPLTELTSTLAVDEKIALLPF